MQISVAHSTLEHSGPAAEEVSDRIAEDLNGTPDLLILYCSDTYDGGTLLRTLTGRFPDCAVHGGTSFRGVMSHEGFHSRQGRGLGVFAIRDPDGAYGVGAAEMNGDPRQAAQTAVFSALDHAGRPGEIPDLVWLIGAPGQEEQVLLGIADILGPSVPVAGGSSADNDVAGNWSQFSGDRIHGNAVTLSVLFPSGPVSYAFHSGYTPTETRGVVTRADSHKAIEIDGEPAARVYNRWTGGIIEHALPGGGNILSATTLYPLGREVGQVERMGYYRLSHPDSVTAAQELTLFSEIQQGDEVVLMTGDRNSLVSRAGRVAESAIRARELTPDGIAGALVIYCAGCMLAVQDDMPEVANNLNRSLGGRPFLGTFTFGEQGCFLEGENYHGNLMISVVIFGR